MFCETEISPSARKLAFVRNKAIRFESNDALKLRSLKSIGFRKANEMQWYCRCEGNALKNNA